LLDLEGMETELAIKLSSNGVRSRDELADLGVDELTEMTGIDAERGGPPDHGGASPLV